MSIIETIATAGATIASGLLGGWVGGGLATRAAREQAKIDSLERSADRKHAEEISKWNAKWQLLSTRAGALEKLIVDIAHWTSHIQILDPNIIVIEPTAEVTTITFMIQALLPTDAPKLIALLYAHYDHCLSTTPENRQPKSANEIYQGLGPLVENRRQITLQLFSMVTEGKEGDSNAEG